MNGIEDIAINHMIIYMIKNNEKMRHAMESNYAHSITRHTRITLNV